jgi:signal transduction histidine kinase
VTFKHHFKQIFIDGGTLPTDVTGRARSIRIGHLISLGAIINTLVIALVLMFIGDYALLMKTLGVALIYLTCYLVSILGGPDLGRPAILITGNFVIFYFSSIFRGEANLQVFFFSLVVAPFMFFSWQEKRFYGLALLGVVFYVIGELQGWNFFNEYHHNYNLRAIRVVSVLGTMNSIIMGYYYFLKQSLKFEAASLAYLAQLDVEYKKQLQLQKMSSLGEMAGGISHEINNPLMVISGKASMLRRELEKRYPGESFADRHLEKISEMVMRISKIINALKSFSRSSSEHEPAKEILLEKVIEMSLDVCREHFISQNVKLELAIEKDLHLVCRKAEMSQVLLNLLNNAFDACVGLPDPRVWVTARTLKDKLEILVEDNGPGIAPELEHKIMQPFFTTKDVGKGTGLGLSLCKGLVEGHNGSLALIHNTGRTTFQILLPKSGAEKLTGQLPGLQV